MKRFALTLAVLLAHVPAIAQQGPAPSAQARSSAYAELEALISKIRQTKPAQRSRLLDQLYRQCGEFLDAHLQTATPEQLSLAGTTWLQLAARASDTEAMQARLKTLAALGSLPPDLRRLVRLHRARLKVKVGSQAPPWTAQDLGSGSSLTLKSLRGKLVLLYFWASRNPNAQAFRERKLTPLHARFAGDDRFVLVGVGVRRRGETAELQAAYRKEHAIPWTLAFDASGDCATDYGAADVPFLCLIDAKGKILALGPGWRTVDRIKELLAKRLARESGGRSPPETTQD